ncbi:major facilitator superfamily MFS-1 [Laetiporus sulphureus 93-53]|uniref:Major facilitator superfamily MFS-1 n=1 Tax=Laetiporus sulphureus 93-53 TaxID=1314785 RepID=A0A165I7L1_9APHY|nr:major facilitator superfamily MFS-1 [Laetiporus sulphureus 93-53]KZT12694.1 major facilitator superfamily MFS-1 [Laetiporus sulphureus 93-53]
MLSTLPTGRKLTLLSIFCFSLFLDTFNNSSLFAAIPPIALQLDIPNSQSAWLLSAYQLTFAALLLVSGRVSDLYNPKWVFVIGAFAMGIFALVAGFIRSEVPLLLFRALMGAGGALTIPSAQHLIVHMYPDPVQQAKAVAAFGGMGGIGMVLGLIIGALFVSYTSWPWVFYFSSIVSGVITLSILLLVPNISRTGHTKESRTARVLRFKRLDIIGVTIFAVALILFIFAVTSGATSGWRSARIIVPLIISFVLFVLFFVWEAKIPESYAALPPKMWRYENFTILLAISLVPFMWWGSIFPLFAWYWETVYGWTAIRSAEHFLPIALGIFPTLPISAGLQSKLRLKWVIAIGFFLITAGTLLLPFAGTKERYWPLVFPGFLLGTAGAALIYATTNIALLAVTPSSVSGIVAAVFMCVLQAGGATGVAIVTSIQTSVQISHGGPDGFAGRAAGLWFLVGITGTMGILFLIFMKDTVGPVDPTAPHEHKESLR